MPARAATSATGEATRRRPRPAGASGRGTTATTPCEDCSNASSAGTAGSGVPAKTRRTPLQRLAEGGVRARLDHRGLGAGPVGLADRLHGELALLAVHAVDEQDAVEVVGLVLDAAGQQLRSLEHDRLAEHVLALG